MKTGKRRKRWLIALAVVALLLVGGLNAIAYNHAHCLSHFVEDAPSGDSIARMSWSGKAGIILTGVPVERPYNTWSAAELDADSMIVPGHRGKIEVWRLHQSHDVGNRHILLFPGYTRTKSNLVSEATRYRNLGFTVWMMDFLGAGGSEGNICTGGYDEAEDVRDVYEFVRGSVGKSSTVLFHGNSMGSVAILRAIHDYDIHPDGLVLECPFGTLRSALSCRLSYAGVPTFPLADLVTFWGGFQHGYNGHAFNPLEYAPAVKCPVLHLTVSEDPLLPASESRELFEALGSESVHKSFVQVHGNQHREIVDVDDEEWETAVTQFFIGQFPAMGINPRVAEREP